MLTKEISKTLKFGAVTILSVALMATPLSAQADETAPVAVCANTSLNGYYGFTIQGTLAVPGGTVQNGGGLPIRGLAMTHFDGNGNLTQVDHGVVNGMPQPPNWTPGYGTYTVNADCTGTAVINTASNPGGPLKLHLLVTKHGQEVQQVVDVNAVTALGEKLN